MIKGVVCAHCGTVSMAAVRICGGCGRSPKRHKYGIAAKEKRTYKGVVYDSRAESIRAAELDLIFPNHRCGFWLRQVPIQLGPDRLWRADFMCCERRQALDDMYKQIWYEDVKGVETAAFKRVLKLWKKYMKGGPPLHILKRQSTAWTTEIID